VTYLGTVGVGERAGRTLLQVMFAAGVPAFYVSGRLADRLPAVPYLFQGENPAVHGGSESDNSDTSNRNDWLDIQCQPALLTK